MQMHFTDLGRALSYQDMVQREMHSIILLALHHSGSDMPENGTGHTPSSHLPETAVAYCMGFTVFVCMQIEPMHVARVGQDKKKKHGSGSSLAGDLCCTVCPIIPINAFSSLQFLSALWLPSQMSIPKIIKKKHMSVVEWGASMKETIIVWSDALSF